MSVEHVLPRGTEEPPKELRPGQIGRGGACFERAPEENRVCVAHLVDRVLDEAALSHAGFAHHQHDVTATLFRRGEERRQRFELCLSTDEAIHESSHARSVYATERLQVVPAGAQLWRR